MKEFEVTCVNKPDRDNRHEAISHIGNVNAGWRLTREAAIARIDSKQEAFYTIDRKSGKKAMVGVVREAAKAPYLRTYADGQWANNLLELAECDSTCKLIA